MGCFAVFAHCCVVKSTTPSSALLGNVGLGKGRMCGLCVAKGRLGGAGLHRTRAKESTVREVRPDSHTFRIRYTVHSSPQKVVSTMICCLQATFAAYLDHWPNKELGLKQKRKQECPRSVVVGPCTVPKCVHALRIITLARSSRFPPPPHCDNLFRKQHKT